MPNLRIPGPTPLSEKVLSSLSSQMISHRSSEYEQLHKRIVDNLKYFFQTVNDIFLLTSSGTGGLEAAVANFFSPKEKLIFFTCGAFGNRWAEIGRRFNGDVVQIKFEDGKPADREKVKKTLEKYKKIAGVFVTHNETSTSILNNIKEISHLVKNHQSKPLLLVDSISALGAVDLPMDKLKIDVLVTASQKAWIAPPGIAMIAVSKEAWRRSNNARMPRFYFDLRLYQKYALKNQTPATPAVSALYGLDCSLKMMRKKGREKIFSFHQNLKKYFRKKVREMGLKLVTEDEYSSPTVTAVIAPEKVVVKEWKELLAEKYGIVVAGGKGGLKGKVIRIAHMGYVSKKDMDEVISALKQSLSQLK